MTRGAFEKANEEAAAEGRQPFSNPRNLAAATLRAGSGDGDGPSSAAALAAERRSLSFAAYSLSLSSSGGEGEEGEEGGGKDETPGTHAECLEWLAAQGVGVPDSALLLLLPLLLPPLLLPLFLLLPLWSPPSPRSRRPCKEQMNGCRGEGSSLTTSTVLS